MPNHTQTEANQSHQITKHIDPSNLPRFQIIIRKVLEQPPSINEIHNYTQHQDAKQHLNPKYNKPDQARKSYITSAMISASCVEGQHPGTTGKIREQFKKANLNVCEAFLILRSRSFEAFNIGNCAARSGWMFLQFINHGIFSPENIKMINYPDHDHYVLQIKVNHNGENIYMICDPLLNPELLFEKSDFEKYILPALGTLAAHKDRLPKLNLKITRERAVKLYGVLQESSLGLRHCCKNMLRVLQDQQYLHLLQPYPKNCVAQITVVIKGKKKTMIYDPFLDKEILINKDTYENSILHLRLQKAEEYPIDQADTIALATVPREQQQWQFLYLSQNGLKKLIETIDFPQPIIKEIKAGRAFLAAKLDTTELKIDSTDTDLFERLSFILGEITVNYLKMCPAEC